MATTSFKEFIKQTGGNKANVKVIGNESSPQFQETKVQKPNYFQRVGTDIKNRLGEAVQSQKGAMEGSMNPLSAGANIAKSLSGAVISPLNQALSPIMDKTINPITDKIVETGPVQKVIDAMSKRPELAGTLADLLETGLNVAGIEGGISGVKGGLGKVKYNVENIPKKVGEYTKNVTKDVIPSYDRIVNEHVSKAFDLTPGDLRNIKGKTGNEVGGWLANKNLIKENRDLTRQAVNDYFQENYDAVRSEIGKVPNKYSAIDMPRYTDSLKILKNKLEGIPGLEKDLGTVNQLLANENPSLGDLQTVKELLDEHFELYKNIGDVKAGTEKQGMANIRDEIKTFLEKEVKDKVGSDIAELNNNVATSKSILNAIKSRSVSGLTRSNLSLGDMGTFAGGTAIGGPIGGGIALLGKKLIQSPSVMLRLAKYLDKLSDTKKAKVQKSLDNGEIPTEIDHLINSANTKSTNPTKTTGDNTNSTTATTNTGSQSLIPTSVSQSANNVNEGQDSNWGQLLDFIKGGADKAGDLISKRNAEFKEKISTPEGLQEQTVGFGPGMVGSLKSVAGKKLAEESAELTPKLIASKIDAYDLANIRDFIKTGSLKAYQKLGSLFDETGIDDMSGDLMKRFLGDVVEESTKKLPVKSVADRSLRGQGGKFAGSKSSEMNAFMPGIPTEADTPESKDENVSFLSKTLSSLKDVIGDKANKVLSKLRGIDPKTLVASPITTTLVSDETNTDRDTGFSLVEAQPGEPVWSAEIPGAKWIWRTGTVQAYGPEQVPMEKKFKVNKVPSIATIMSIAGDQEYEVYINDEKVGESEGSKPWTEENKKQFDIKSFLKKGDNTLRIIARNPGTRASHGFWVVDPLKNPAGLKYRVDILDDDGTLEDDDPDPTPEPEIKCPPGYRKVGNRCVSLRMNYKEF